MQPARTPLWQQATAVVSVTASGAITGLSYVPGPAASLASPVSLPVQLLALQQSASAAPAGDAMLRAAIVNVARHYLRLAADSTPAEMEAMIWRRASLDGADHGASCAAFASLTLELGARAAGRSSWVTGGQSYPWPLHSWADVRVDENPSSPAIVSVLQDAEAHDRWHPLGDGYRPLPGDWVLFGGHVEVVTGHSHGQLQTIGGDSLPDFSVNAHEYAGSLAGYDIQGFVDNGRLPSARTPAPGGPAPSSARPAPQSPAGQGSKATGLNAAGTGNQRAGRPDAGAVSGSTGASKSPAQRHGQRRPALHRHGQHHHGLGAPGRQSPGSRAGSAAIPGLWSGIAAAASAAPPASAHAAQPRSAADHPPGPASPAGTASIPGTGAPQPAAPNATARAGHDEAAQQAGAEQRGAGPAGPASPERSPAQAGRVRAGSAPDAAVPGLTAPGGAAAGSGLASQAAGDGHPGKSPAGPPAAAAVPGLADPGAGTDGGASHQPAAWPGPEQSPAGHPADAAVPGITTSGTAKVASGGPASTAPGHVRRDAVTAPPVAGRPPADTAPAPGSADIPGLPAGQQPTGHARPPGSGGGQPSHQAGRHSQPGTAGQHSQPGQDSQPGQHSPSTAPAPALESPAEQAFISEIAPGAVAAQRRYGVPASVTIAQAIMESGWGQSVLAARDHNLFGIKGTGPAGTDLLPTREFQDGHWVTVDAGFRVYHNDAESIDDHGRLLATSGFYTRAMQERRDPNAFADALTGVYATDPGYGAQLITLMRRYDLQRFDLVSAGAGRRGPATQPLRPGPSRPANAPLPSQSPRPSSSAPSPAPAPATPAPSPSPSPSASTASTTAAFSEPAIGAAAAPAAPDAAGSGQGPAPAAASSTPSALAGLAGEPARAESSASAVRTGRATPATRAGRPRKLALYRQPVPLSVRNAFVTSAKVPLIRAEPLYRDVAGHYRVPWQLLAACDWMQCKARLGYSPVHGEKLGTANPDGSSYRTKSAALAQCAEDLTCLARAVYGIQLNSAGALSVRELAEVFAAFRWGALLRTHSTSAMEFPYSVAGLTALHLGMRWPAIPAMGAPDKPGSRFRMPFGAVPVVLRLGYPATT